MTDFEGALPIQSEDFVRRRLELGKKIIDCQASLSMPPVQQGFSGFVPTGLACFSTLGSTRIDPTAPCQQVTCRKQSIQMFDLHSAGRRTWMYPCPTGKNHRGASLSGSHTAYRHGKRFSPNDLSWPHWLPHAGNMA